MSLIGVDLTKEFGTHEQVRKRSMFLLPLTEGDLRGILSVAAAKSWTTLDLSGLSLNSVPAELGQLANLTSLDLSRNQLMSVPFELEKLVNLTWLNLSANKLMSVPPGLGRLASLKRLCMFQNNLASLPPEVARLTKLTYLSLSQNRLASLPAELGRLTGLTMLILSQNKLESLPPELGQLTKLTGLFLAENRLASVPSELGQLTSLVDLSLALNQLRSLPSELGQLTNLKTLDLSHNQLVSLPHDIARLTRLTRLDLSQNCLTALPPELGQLTNLTHLTFEGNPLKSPPPEIVSQGMQATFEYLRGLLRDSKQTWISKLLLVGEGGVGKTSLVHRLLHEEWNPTEDTTRGVKILDVPMNHPSKAGVIMHLNAWDFGGQEIYHATHQFFLSNRSLFLLLWNARLGYEQGKIPYWLDTIQARAPESPVIIVATHTDQRDADIPLADLRRKYPQIVGHLSVSNASGKGVPALEKMIREVAAALPLMGELWPRNWDEAASEVRTSTCKYLSSARFSGMLAKHGLSEGEARILGRMLHDLGEILYFDEDPELRDIIILKPQWVTQYISRILDSEKVAEGLGVLKKSLMTELWDDLDPSLHEQFLRLMEKFDLSYRTLTDPDVSIVVERLSFEAPEGYDSAWCRLDGRPQINMRFDFGSTVPAGVPTYFIARSHRFTTYKHWRRGAVFVDGKDRKHFALVRSDPDSRYLELTARGPMPQAFFTLLRDGLELTLARFPGLPITRTLPCPGHNGKRCLHRFDLRLLEKAIERNPPAETVQCGETLENVSVTEILYGLHWKTESKVLATLKAMKQSMQDELAALRELTQRGFARQFRTDQSLIESECPSTFVLYPADQKVWAKKLVGRESVLHLFCQQPGEWHPTGRTGTYHIDEAPEWYSRISPLLAQVVKVIKYAKPAIGPLADVAIPNFDETFKQWVDLTEELAEVAAMLSRELDVHDPFFNEVAKQYYGEPLRELRGVLDKYDPKHIWGGLQKVLTPEGDYLWLCPEHAKQYRI